MPERFQPRTGFSPIDLSSKSGILKTSNRSCDCQCFVTVFGLLRTKNSAKTGLYYHLIIGNIMSLFVREGYFITKTSLIKSGFNSRFGLKSLNFEIIAATSFSSAGQPRFSPLTFESARTFPSGLRITQ